MAASVGPPTHPPHADERAVFTQLKPVRMSEGAEDASVFEDAKPPVSPGARPASPVQVGGARLRAAAPDRVGMLRLWSFFVCVCGVGWGGGGFLAENQGDY